DGETQQSYDMVAYRNRTPVAILHVQVQPQAGTAQFVAMAFRADSADLTNALLASGIRSALRHRGALVFATPDTAALTASLVALYFLELGRLMRYAPSGSTAALEADHERMD